MNVGGRGTIIWPTCAKRASTGCKGGDLYEGPGAWTVPRWVQEFDVRIMQQNTSALLFGGFVARLPSVEEYPRGMT